MAASSSSTVDELQPQYQVFISFRRVGLRDGFVNHLVNALVNHKINYFIDNSEVRGQPLEDVVFKRIGTSRIALVILTSDYTESARRLQQLKKIKECVDEGKMVAIPIFYKLEPSTVRHMKGAFGDAFTNLEESDETKRKWKEALKSIPELMGIIVHEESYERSAVNEIVEGVQKVLQFTSVSNPRDAITRTNGDFFDRNVTSPRKVQPPQSQVFINFRGDQLRKYFVGYLADALRRSGINVFIDKQEHIGEDLTNLFKRIEDSGIAIVVFSSRYTESKWCLEELVKIKERVEQGRLKVIPVFYQVTPTNVKRLKGEFGDNFRDREFEFESDEPKIKRWKEALAYVSHKFALTFDEKSSALEIEFVNNIVKEVLKKLQDIYAVERSSSSR